MDKTLFDTYHESGTSAEVFLGEMNAIAAKTEFVTVNPADIIFLSYHRTDNIPDTKKGGVKRIYYFYKLDKHTLTCLAEYNNGLTDVPFSVFLRDEQETSASRFFDDIVAGSGLMIAYYDALEKNTSFFGVSKYAVTTLCKKAALKGDRVHENSLFRDMYVADGILPGYLSKDDFEAIKKSGRQAEEGIKFVVRRNGKSAFGVLVGVFSGSYSEIGMTAIAEIYEDLRCGTRLGEAVMKHWEVDQGKATVEIEFPQAAERIQKKYKLPTKFIPGIKLTSSDSGLSSLTISGTYRMDGTDCMAIVGEYTRKHTGEIIMEEVREHVEKEVLNKIEEFPKGMASLCNAALGDFDLDTELGRHLNAEAIRSALGDGLEKLSCARALGNKRTTLVKEKMLAENGDNRNYTMFDIAGMLFRLEEFIGVTPGAPALGETTKEYIYRELAKLPGYCKGTKNTKKRKQGSQGGSYKQ